MSQHFEVLQSSASKQAALTILLQHLPANERLAHAKHLLETLNDAQSAASLLFFQASHDNNLQAICLAQVQVGKVALLWPPRALQPELEHLLQPLLSFAFSELKARGISVVQSLIDCHASTDANLLYSAGCQKIADLAYMMLEAPHYPEQSPVVSAEFHMVAPHDTRLAHLLEQTYENSLDCPLLDGWRNMDDVIDSYWATGTPREKLWRIAHTSEGDAGCVIAAEYPQVHQWELIYLGVSPRFRGLGWGKVLLHWLLHAAKEEMIERVLLAVDVANDPAISIYKEFGFEEIDRRLAIAKQL
jgi:mycothiol synthase